MLQAWNSAEINGLVWSQAELKGIKRNWVALVQPQSLPLPGSMFSLLLQAKREKENERVLACIHNFFDQLIK